MRIAVDTRFLQQEDLGAHKGFSGEVFASLAEKHPEEQFFFLLDRRVNGSLKLPPNVSLIIITPGATGFLRQRWWFDIKVPSALKNCKADVFVCPNSACSLTTSVPQVLIIQELLVPAASKSFSKLFTYFHYEFLSRLLRKAKKVATLSTFVKKRLADKYKIAAEKIEVISSAGNSLCTALDWQEREQMKELYAAGCEYFVFPVAPYNRKSMVGVLKAFSIFKKWQKTNMKLVIVGAVPAGVKEEGENLNNYKYRTEINITGTVSADESAKVVAGAYAIVYPSHHEQFPAAVVDAMECNVPVITSRTGSIPEIAEEAALYVSTENPNEMAEQMKRIFKDEQLRNKLIQEGKQRASLFNWDKTVDLLWNTIRQAVSK